MCNVVVLYPIRFKPTQSTTHASTYSSTQTTNVWRRLTIRYAILDEKKIRSAIDIYTLDQIAEIKKGTKEGVQITTIRL